MGEKKWRKELRIRNIRRVIVMPIAIYVCGLILFQFLDRAMSSPMRDRLAFWTIVSFVICTAQLLATWDMKVITLSVMLFVTALVLVPVVGGLIAVYSMANYPYMSMVNLDVALKEILLLLVLGTAIGAPITVAIATLIIRGSDGRNKLRPASP